MAASGKASASGKAPASGEAHEAIVGALEHGSHTVAELAVVTAVSAAAINRGVRALAGAGVVRKTEREGKPAWALVAAG
jgi:predicted transcriptional regulator